MKQNMVSQLTKSKWLLAIAILLGIITALIFRSYLRGMESSGSAGKSISIVVARQNISKGTSAEKSLIAFRKIPAKFLPGEAVLLKDYELILGQQFKVDIKKGAPILWLHFEGERKKLLSDRIPDKKRAITIGVDELTGVGGMISPCDFVDILFTCIYSGEGINTSRVITITLLQDVPVISTGRLVFESQMLTSFSRKSGYSSVTLSVTPSEAGLLAFAQEHGKLCLTLRNPHDREKKELQGITFDFLKSFHNKE